MNTKPKIFISMLLALTILLVNFGGMPGIVYAEEGDNELIITVTPVLQCGDVEYTISWENGSPPYLFTMDYGDGDTTEILTLEEDNININYTYIDHGEYEWTVRVEEIKGELVGSTVDIITIDGPTLTLNSDPFPPLIVLGEGNNTVKFSPEVTGGTLPYQYTWNLDGNWVATGEAGDTVPFTYSTAGKYQAEVMVTDSCEFASTDTLPVVVVNPGDVCHPAAQKIADGVNSIFPNQADDLYTCEDIYDIFNGSLTGDQLGFGRMWKAYNLAQTIEELTWEEIRDWHLDAGGWGALLQLDRFSDLLEDHSIGDLMVLVMSEEYSLADVRTAARSATRYEADFEDALNRIAEGTNAGELGQLYKLAADLEVDPSAIDEYLADGLTLSELKHTANIADQLEVDWTEIAEFRASADSWGDIKQAYSMATDEISAAEILIFGIQEYRKDLQEADKEEREEQQAAQKEEKDKQTGEKLAEQFSVEFDDVMNLLNGECEGDWSCVRKTLRDQEKIQSEGLSEKDLQTALQISSKYGYSEEAVIEHYNSFCSEDWACTRAHFRELYMDANVKGKPDNPGKPKK
jgi:hypothetical protein